MIWRGSFFMGIGKKWQNSVLSGILEAMKSWANLFRVIVLIIGIIVIAVNVQLYNLFERQKNDISTMSDLQKAEAQETSNKLKSQQDQIDRLGKDLEDAQQQIRDQNQALAQQGNTLDDQKNALAGEKDALLQEVEKRQQLENENKSMQTSLVDTKAEADALKQEMKEWQKDYVAVLADLEKKMDNSQDEIKVFEDNLAALNIPGLKESIKSLKAEIEKMAAVPEDKVEHTEIQSQ